MKILVTGANGFVGKNLIATLESIRDSKDNTRDVPKDLEIFSCARNVILSLILSEFIVQRMTRNL